MKVIRSLVNFKTSDRFSYDDPNKFVKGIVKNGLHSLKINNRWFDLGYESRGSDTLLVCFHAAVGKNLKSSPLLSGRAVAAEIGSDWISFADPSVSHPDELETGWHLSTKRVPAQEIVRSTVNELKDSGRYKNVIFFGSSAGGFAALNQSYNFPGSIAFVMNPVVDIHNEAKRFWNDFCSEAYVGWSHEAVENKLNTSMSKLYSGSIGNRVLYLQNLQDEYYLNNHFKKFVETVGDKSRVLTYHGNWGQGHLVPPRWLYINALKTIMEASGQWNQVFELRVANPS